MRFCLIILSLLFLTSCSKQGDSILAHADDTEIQVCFTPGQDCTNLLIDHINASQKSIEVQAYFFTSYKIAKALVQAASRGVTVEIILDKSQFDPAYASVTPFLERAHLIIYEDTRPKIAHNKIMIFDHETVMTGSFNFTYSAQNQNAENMLIIQNTALAEAYLDNWNARKKQSNRIN